MMDPTDNVRPPLPPRRTRSPPPSPPAVMSSNEAERSQNLPQAAEISSPRTAPPLPRRRPPSPVLLSQNIDPPSTPIAQDLRQSREPSQDKVTEATPLSGPNVTPTSASPIHVSITPATPPPFRTPTDDRPTPSLAAQTISNGSPSAPVARESEKGETSIPPRPPLSAQPSTASKSTEASRGFSRESVSTGSSPIPALYLSYLGLLALVLNLAHPMLSPFWLFLIGLGSIGYLWLKAKDERAKVVEPIDPSGHEASSGKDAVSWVNHVLYALFPLISTDVLTPFMDLMEDALVEQVPPIVTSVRLTSAALGSQPVLLTSLRPMTDQEWFASISARKPSGKHTDGQQKGHRKSLSSSSPSPPAAASSGSHSKHRRTISADTSKSRGSLKRSISGSSYASMLDSDTIEVEAGRRRKRDRILQGLSRRRLGRSAGDLVGSEGMDDSGVNSRSGKTASEAAQTEDGKRIRGGLGGETAEDDPDAGQYVNFQVGFEYKRTEATTRRGWGLHLLAYFGWGVKGVGSSEIPVYIDVISFSGMINLRLLLSATPPFVRTARISLPSLPEFDISAKPLLKAAFNAMELPGMKSYVKASISDVCKAFVRPESFSLDVDRLLLGREASLRTGSVGVLYIILHSASNLPKTDTMGSCDPYVTISLTKFNKPVFSTRTIIDSPDPVWEEPAFVLISADAIESGEKLRLRVSDADRFSADDTMGAVEVDLADLVDEHTRSGGEETLTRRTDALKADRMGMKAGGELTWSVKFSPIWEIPEAEVQAKMEEKRKSRAEPDVIKPWWLDLVEKYCAQKPDWDEARNQRRKDALAFFTGERDRDEMEVASKPSDELRSGVLQFHIHQCNDLEVESLEGTYSSSSNHRKSAAAGRPALADVVDRTPAENPDPPSAYCEVHLNDRLVYRTRTKQLTPLPYFNAVSERFVRDWKQARIVFVVRDERDREHDPILGLVSMRLHDAFSDRSQFTRWFPLVGGLGWGRIRLSLLWKPLDIKLPRGVSGYETATFEIRSLTSTDMGRLVDKGVSLVIETETDKYTLLSKNQGALASTVSFQSTATRQSVNFDEQTEVDWGIQKPIRLAVEWRHSCSVLFSFVARTGMLKKKRIVGLATTRLDYCPDNQIIERTIPVFATTEVKEAMKAHYNWTAAQRDRNRAHYPSDAKLVGFVNLSFVVRPGVSRAHRKLCKRDLRFRHVYEAWEAAKEADLLMDQMHGSDVVTRDSNGEEITSDEKHDEDDDLNDDDESDTTDYDDDGDTTRESAVDGVRRRPRQNGGPDGEGKGKSDEAQLEQEAEEEDEGFLSERRAHSRALHKHHKGIFQLKIARTGKFVKDKLEAKMYSSKMGRERRMRGPDMDVEVEGQSSL